MELLRKKNVYIKLAEAVSMRCEEKLRGRSELLENFHTPQARISHISFPKPQKAAAKTQTTAGHSKTHTHTAVRWLISKKMNMNLRLGSGLPW
jgi:hypothetical protein